MSSTNTEKNEKRLHRKKK